MASKIIIEIDNIKFFWREKLQTFIGQRQKLENYLWHKFMDTPIPGNKKVIFTITDIQGMDFTNPKPYLKLVPRSISRDLTEDQVRQIRRLSKQGKTHVQIAKKYNVKPHTIYSILRGGTYQWVIDK